MTKVYHKVTRTTERNELYSISCDLCGELVIGDKDWPPYWPGKNISSTEISCAMGWSAGYGDGGNKVIYEYDICTRCFMQKLVPLLEELYSAKPTIRDEDW